MTAGDEARTYAAVELRGVTKSFGAARQAGGAINAVSDIDLVIRPGEFFTLLGPSGCGKTTTLRLIAGFELPTRGSVLIQGRDVSEIPAHYRPVNTVFQSYALFPHLTVEDNVGFGLSLKRVPRDARRQRSIEALKMVKMDHAAGRRPSELSGGQQQRVALARALVNRPSVLLLDEPLGALDLKLRKEMQLELKHMQRQLGITFIFVTHDQEEALTMSDRIAIMNAGKVLQVDDPIGIYERPTTRFGADFIGETNFLPASISAASTDQVTAEIAGRSVLIQKPATAVQTGAAVTLAIRPEAIVFAGSDERLPGALDLEGCVREIIYIGTDRRYVIDLDQGQPLVVRLQNSTAMRSRAPAIGERVHILIRSSDIRALTD